MATVKIKFRPSTNESKEGTISYKIIHKRMSSLISTKYKVFPTEWDNTEKRICIPAEAKEFRKVYLSDLQIQMSSDIARIESIIHEIEITHTSYKASDVTSLFLAPKRNIGFIAYARQIIAKLEAIGKPVAANYKSALSSFIKFHGESEVMFYMFNQDLMVAYECWLKDHVCRNSSSCYMRNLHAIYNRAIDEGIVTDGRNPFHRVYTGVDKTQKRAVSISAIQKIRDADLSPRPALAFARDLFMFSFYTQGMSFIDMAFLEQGNIKDGILVYRRHKTQQTIRMQYVEEIKELVSKYRYKCHLSYLLPILKEANKAKARHEYKTASQRIDRNLKKLGVLLDIPVKLTMYVARHSWATAAQSNHVPITAISRCLGHDSEETTAIYLTEIETSETDKANEIVLRCLSKRKKKSEDNKIGDKKRCETLP